MTTPEGSLKPRITASRRLGSLQFRFVAAVPFDGPAETFFEINRWLVAKKLLCPGNVGERVLNVSSPLGTVFHFSGVPDQFLQKQERLVQIRPSAGGHVDYFSRDLAGLGLARQQICSDHILDVSKIAALLAITKNSRLFPAQHLTDELGQNTRVRRSRVLPRAKDIEVAQTHSLQAITAEKRSHVVFARQLGGRVRGNGVGRHVFPFG